MAKQKLTDLQKQTLKNLEWFVKNGIQWKGDRDLKDAVLDGHLAVFSIRGSQDRISQTQCFDTLTLTNSKKNAQQVVEYNLSTRAIIVDLITLYVMEERYRSFIPEFFAYKGPPNDT